MSDWQRDYDNRHDRAYYRGDNNFDRDYAGSFGDDFNNEAYEYRRSNERNYDYDRGYERDRNYDRGYDGVADTEYRDSKYERRELGKERPFGDKKLKNLFQKKDRQEYQDPVKEAFGEPTTASNMIIYSPRTYKDVKTLIDYLRNREPIIVDLVEIKHDKGQRILDFLSGAIYALNGSMHKISGSIYLLTPYGVNIMVPSELEERIRKNNDDR
ncbi:MAG: cell division protein SepF [Clostridia bacterium]|nr:cell division protein SepF [Clostridia bacterium]